MARPTTDRVRRVADQLRRDVATSLYQRGDAFPSARAISRRHGVSYQTAHRLLRQLVVEGLLVTRQGAGTYVAAESDRPRRVLFRFHPRAKRKRSFGGQLKTLLEAQLRKQSIPYRTSWVEPTAAPAPDVFPVAWEADRRRRPTTAEPQPYGLLLNDRRVHGLAATRLDTICVDDFSGGVCAAQLIREQLAGGAPADVAVVAAEADDVRNADRVAGFRSILPVGGRLVLETGGWTDADAHRATDTLLRLKPRYVFCCNDRLAQGVLRRCRELRCAPPALVGFDNAPIAEEIGLTTVGIPWREFVAAATEVIVKRLAGDRTIARRQVFPLQPVLRASHRPGWDRP